MGKETNWTRGCNDNYRQQSPYRRSGTLFLGDVYSSACETVNTLFQSCPDVIVTTGDTMDSLMRSERNCSLLIKSHSSHYARAQWLSPGCWLSSDSLGAIIAAKATPSRHPRPFPSALIQTYRAKGRGLIIVQIFCSHRLLFLFSHFSFISRQLVSAAAVDQIDKRIF